MRLWSVECKGKFQVRALVNAESRQRAVQAAKDQTAGHIHNFMDGTLSMTDIIAGLNQCTWISQAHPEGIVNLDWELTKA